MRHETSKRLKKIILKIRRPTMLFVGASLFAVSIWLRRTVSIQVVFKTGGILLDPEGST